MEVFKAADKDGSGQLEKDEIAGVFTIMSESTGVPNPNQLELDVLFYNMDEDCSGYVAFFPPLLCARSMYTPHTTHHTSHTTRHTPHVTHHTPHVTRHTSHREVEFDEFYPHFRSHQIREIQEMMFESNESDDE